MTTPEITLLSAGAEPVPGSYLYFLVSAARRGPLAGAFKLGVAGSFAARYQQHTRVWKDRFDLSRSCLLRTDRRQEVQWLEKHLKRLFGEPGPDGRSWRRDPGRRADGHTEWFELACLEPMLAQAEGAVALRSALGVRTQVIRGLGPADCALVGLAPDGTPLPPPLDSRAEPRALAHARRAQERAAEDAQAAALAGAALELAQCYDAHLLWVGLDVWRWHLAHPHLQTHRTDAGWADLYFGRFGPPRALPQRRSADEPPPTPAQMGFEEACERRMAAAAPAEAGCSHQKLEPSCRLMDAVYSTCGTASNERLVQALGSFPHPVCADALVLRLNFKQREAIHAFFPRFKALAERVESRLPREQSVLC